MPAQHDLTAVRDGDRTPQFIIEQRRAIWRHLERPKTDHQLAELMRRPLTQVHATLHALQDSGLVRSAPAHGHNGQRRYRRVDGKAAPELRRSRLSPQQRQLLGFLNRPRAMQEIAARLDLKSSAVTKLLADLRDAGAIVKTVVPGGRPRDFYCRRDAPIDLASLYRHRPGTAQRILRLLQTPLSPAQIAQTVGVSPQRVRQAIGPLLAAGLVRRVPIPGRTRTLFLRNDVDGREATQTITLRADQQRLLAHLDTPRTAAELARRLDAPLARTTLLLNDLAALGRIHSALPPGMRRRRCYWRAGIDIDPTMLRPPLTAKEAQLLKLLDEPRPIRWLARRCEADPITTQVRLDRMCERGYAVRTDLPGSQLPRVFYCRPDVPIDIRKLKAARCQQRLLTMLRKPCSIAALSDALQVTQPTITADLDKLIASGVVAQRSRQQGAKPALYCRADSLPRSLEPMLTKLRRNLLHQLRQPRLLSDLADRTSIDYPRLIYELAYLRRHRLARKLRLGGNKHAVAFCRTGVSFTPKVRRKLRRKWSAQWLDSLRACIRRRRRRRL